MELFNPRRNNITKKIKCFSNIGENIVGFIGSYLYSDKKIIYRKIKGKKVMLHNNYIVYQTCPHLGCKLVFNEIEKTWDCPCHGSRFNIGGKVISGPAKKDITFKK